MKLILKVFFAWVLTIGAVAFAEDAYVASNGSQGINTGYCMTPDTRWEVDFQLTATTPLQGRIVGGDGFSPNFYVSCYINGGGNFSFGAGDTFQSFSTGLAADTARHTAILDCPAKKMTYVNAAGVTNWTGTINVACTKTATVPLVLCAVANSAAVTTFLNCSAVKIYGFKVYEQGVRVRDFKPCLQAGVPGLRDAVTGAFVKDDRAGGAALAYGGDIEELEDGFVQSAGTQCVNSRYFMNPGTKVEIDYALTVATSNSQWRLVGADKADCNAYSAIYIGFSGVSFGTGDSFTGHGTGIAPDLLRHTCVIDSPNNKYTYITGATTNWSGTIASTRTKTAAHPMGIFANSTNSDGTKFVDPAKAKIYRLKFWTDGALVHDYLPCVQGGVAGFKDLVDGAFVTSGGLTSGGDITAEEGDGYIECTNGNCYIDTGYYFGPKTRIDADFAFIDTAVQQFVFEVGPEVVGRFYVNGGTNYAWTCKDDSGNWTSTDVPLAAYVRRFGTIDAASKKVSFSTAGFTNYTATISSCTKTCTKALILFANVYRNANYAKMRLYGFKIYEDGMLVRDYVPYVIDGVAGVKDTVGGSFTASGNGSAFAWGGDIQGEQDAYIEADGTQAINTGYFPNPETKVVADFRMVEVVGQMRPFGEANTMNAELYIDGTATNAGNFAFGVGDTWRKSKAMAADLKRHVASLDIKNKAYSITTDGETSLSGPITNACTKTAGYPLALCAKAENAGGTTFSCRAKMRLYSAKIYESGVLVHEFLPYKNGAVIGLYDTVTGTVKTDALSSGTAFQIGGMGVDGVGAAFEVVPQNTKVSPNKTVALTAYAPGAVSYRWTKNGDVVAGETDGSLTVAWEKMPRQSVYAVTPVYSVNGRAVDGTAAEATVENLSRGMTICIR
ncbi:MAG TPA: hypothetical protein PLG22_15435 [Kiritimatiellia bacterium]|nr:hypothetical protein [Kiritimatiellia bacterium]